MTIPVRSEQFAVADGRQINHPKGWLAAYGSLRTCAETLQYQTVGIGQKEWRAGGH